MMSNGEGTDGNGVNVGVGKVRLSRVGVGVNVGVGVARLSTVGVMVGVGVSGFVDEGLVVGVAVTVPSPSTSKDTLICSSPPP